MRIIKQKQMEDFFGFEEILKELGNDTISEITDFKKKEIGDRVTIIDYSSITKYINNIFFNKENLHNIQYFIVIDTNKNHKYCSNDITYIQDIIIVNPQNKEMYRICSRHTKLFN